MASRPDAAAMRIASRKLEVDQRLARNQRSAAIDLRGMVAKDFGAADPSLDDSLISGLLPVEVQTGLAIEIPIPLRKARGDLERVRADKRRVDLDVRWLSDRIEMEVRSAHASLVAAYRNVELARRAVAVSERLAEAERRRFVRGDSDLLRVNLREIAATDAATAEVDALAAYHRAVADYVAAVGGPSLVVAPDPG
jgi:outer membrane protein TolC